MNELMLLEDPCVNKPISRADFDIHFPPLSGHDTDSGYALAISQAQNRCLRTQSWHRHRDMPFSKWWYLSLDMNNRKILVGPRMARQELQRLREYRQVLRKNVARRRDVAAWCWMTVEWSGDSNTVLSLPPLIAPGEKYVPLEALWPNYVRAPGFGRAESGGLKAREENTGAAFGGIDLTLEALFDFDGYHGEVSISNYGEEQRPATFTSAAQVLPSVEHNTPAAPDHTDLAIAAAFQRAQMGTKRRTSSHASTSSHKRTRIFSPMYGNEPAAPQQVQIPTPSEVQKAPVIRNAEGNTPSAALNSAESAKSPHAHDSRLERIRRDDSVLVEE